MTVSLAFRNVILASVALRIGLIIYSEWHDAHSVVKYTDVDYRVFTDAAGFILQPGDDSRAQGHLARYLGENILIGNPYARETYRYTPILALLLTPNIWFHPSFGKYLFAACDIINGLIIHKLLLSYLLPSSSSSSNNSKASSSDPSLQRQASLYTALHLLNPLIFSISTRGSSESILASLVLLTLQAMFSGRYDLAAALLGLSTHWKIYPVVYATSCLCIVGSGNIHDKGRNKGFRNWWKRMVNTWTIRFALISAGTFFLLGGICYGIWGYPFLYESYLYHLHRLDHRHNFSPYFYLTYLTYPAFNSSSLPTYIGTSSGSPSLSLLDSLLCSPLTSFLFQLSLSLGTGLLFASSKFDLPFAWFVQTATFVIFNKVCTSQYFLWYIILLPLILPNLCITRIKGILFALAWVGTQVLWLSEAYKLEFIGQDVFASLWIRGLVYVLGNCWVLCGLMNAYRQA